MVFSVNATLEIDGKALSYSKINLSQAFNSHHEFEIVLDHDVLENPDSFSLDTSRKFVGKTAIITAVKKTDDDSTEILHFKGIVTDISLEKSALEAEIVIKGYSPTILLEDGETYASFYEETLADIIKKSTENFAQSECSVEASPQTTSKIAYVCKYRESSFHFINRLSQRYGEPFYFNGKSLIFGLTNEEEIVELTSGVDAHNLKLGLRVTPLENKDYAYFSKDDEPYIANPTKVEGLDANAQFMFDVASNMYIADEKPLMPPSKNKQEADFFAEKQLEAKAADMVSLSGYTINPSLGLGNIVLLKITRPGEEPEDAGSYIITGVQHSFMRGGQYRNSFEALSSWVRGIPVPNTAPPFAEPQYAWVTDDKDPDKKGRVRVRMQWQAASENTDWIWVMSPDAGSGKDGAGGAGLVVIPQKGDRVMIGFVYNHPDRPYVMGSLFNGKSGSEGASRCLTGRSGASVCINDATGAVTIQDKTKKDIMVVSGDGKITIDATTSITLKVGDSTITITTDTITLKAATVKIDADNADLHGKTKAVLKQNDSTYYKAEGGKNEMKSSESTVEGTMKAALKGVSVEVNGTGMTEVKGGLVKINS